METKPFFYRIVAADFVAEILKLKDGEHKDWLIQFGLDLVAGEGSTKYAKKVISEVQEYRTKQAENGRNRWKDLNKRKERVAKRAISEPVGSHEGCTGNSSSISSSSTETETLKPKVKTSSSSDDEGHSGNGKFYASKKNRKLMGKCLERFEKFWEVFDYKSGKAEAADAWIDCKIFTDATFDKVIAGAINAAFERPELIRQGKIPKMAQGWLTARRWEDEPTKSKLSLCTTPEAY